MYSTVECSTTNNLLLTFSSGPQHGTSTLVSPRALCSLVLTGLVVASVNTGDFPLYRRGSWGQGDYRNCLGSEADPRLESGSGCLLDPATKA